MNPLGYDIALVTDEKKDGGSLRNLGVRPGRVKEEREKQRRTFGLLPRFVYLESRSGCGVQKVKRCKFENTGKSLTNPFLSLEFTCVATGKVESRWSRCFYYD